MAGLAILKHTHDLSDEDLCERWVENPYYQLFCGEEFFQHKLPFDRSSLTRWRQRMGEEKLVALIQESLAIATRTGAAKPADFSKVIVDTTVQPKAVAFPTDAKLMHRARERLVRLAKKHGVALRQSYARVGKHALIAHQRYAHAKQFKRANRALKTIRTYLGRVIRDIVAQDQRRRRTAGDLRPSAVAGPRACASSASISAGGRSIRLHAPEVECIGKGKSHRPYEFGVKVSLATTLHRSKGGQFIAHVKALPGNPYDGHTLRRHPRDRGADRRAPRAASSPTAAIAATTRRPTYKFKVYISGQRRGVTEPSSATSAAARPSNPSSATPRASTAWAATSSPAGDAANAVLAAAGYNFRRLLAWLRLLAPSSSTPSAEPTHQKITPPSLSGPSQAHKRTWALRC